MTLCDFNVQAIYEYQRVMSISVKLVLFLFILTTPIFLVLQGWWENVAKTGLKSDKLGQIVYSNGYICIFVVKYFRNS